MIFYKKKDKPKTTFGINKKYLFTCNKIILNLGGAKNITECNYKNSKISFLLKTRKLVNITYFRTHNNIIDLFFKKNKISFSSELNLTGIFEEIKYLCKL